MILMTMIASMDLLFPSPSTFMTLPIHLLEDPMHQMIQMTTIASMDLLFLSLSTAITKALTAQIQDILPIAEMTTTATVGFLFLNHLTIKAMALWTMMIASMALHFPSLSIAVMAAARIEVKMMTLWTMTALTCPSHNQQIAPTPALIRTMDQPLQVLMEMVLTLLASQTPATTAVNQTAATKALKLPSLRLVAHTVVSLHPQSLTAEMLQLLRHQSTQVQR